MLPQRLVDQRLIAHRPARRLGLSQKVIHQVFIQANRDARLAARLRLRDGNPSPRSAAEIVALLHLDSSYWLRSRASLLYVQSVHTEKVLCEQKTSMRCAVSHPFARKKAKGWGTGAIEGTAEKIATWPTARRAERWTCWQPQTCHDGADSAQIARPAWRQV